MDTNRTHPTTNKAPVIPGFCENSASAVIQIAVIVPTQEIAKRCAGNAMMYMVLLPSTRTRVAGVMEIRTPTNVSEPIKYNIYPKNRLSLFDITFTMNFCNTFDADK